MNTKDIILAALAGVGAVVLVGLVVALVRAAWRTIRAMHVSYPWSRGRGQKARRP